ncbi:hypothetical protein QYE76_003606 [Lolium multiflorum]|uniref:DYW domain-containing protein n=1 Tax=Lolium multiflorum TaxID=4521 RepID=A0AAD8RSU8_LOLMU|nr:hypothetical protein QYE76_003606 [Lolium multiflorum]
MRCPSTVSWTALIAAYMNTGRVKEAVAAAREALATGMRPDSITAVRVLSVCAQAADLDTGEVAWRAALREGIATRLFVATAAVNLYVKCGQIAKAREVFDKMPEKDAVAWGAMVGGYASSGHPREALELFSAMQTQGVRPDCYTVAHALSACTRLGALDLGRQAAGAVDWDEFLDDPVLGTALIHRDPELAEHVLKQLILLEPRNYGNYLVLSNFYSNIDRWKDAKKVRLDVKDKGVNKVCAYSWVVFSGKVHEFRVGDKSHHLTGQIYKKLDELGMELKNMGYSPTTDVVLFDLEDQEKEHTLVPYSEKLAIAFGLLSTRPGDPIRVTNNLRDSIGPSLGCTWNHLHIDQMHLIWDGKLSGWWSEELRMSFLTTQFLGTALIGRYASMGAHRMHGS